MSRIPYLFVCLILFSCSDNNNDEKNHEEDSCTPRQAFEYPLDYTLTAAGMTLHTSDGDVPVTMGAWGAHTGPHTGHAEGKASSDWDGLFVTDWADSRLVKFSDGQAFPGECQPTDFVCGVHTDDIINRIPNYIAPVDGFRITRIELAGNPESNDPDSADGANPYDEFNWTIDGRSCGFSYGLGHIGSISEDLRQAMLKRGLPDPATQMARGEIFHDYENPIVLDLGDTIGKPQVRWEELEDHPGYVKGNGTIQGVPSAQIEFDIIRNDVEYTVSEAEWNYLSAEKRAMVEQAIIADATNPESFRFAQEWVEDWLWRAELVLEATPPFDIADSSSLFSRMGGWFERTGGLEDCDIWGDEQCDETFAIFPIHKESPLYSADLYDSPETTYLVQFTTRDDTDWGEVLEVGVSPVAGTLTVKWRPREADEYYQALSYRVLDGELLMNHGASAPSQLSVVVPAIPSESARCDTVDQCYVLDDFSVQGER